jgi:NADH-quinone oxidoreductase subunit G
MATVHVDGKPYEMNPEQNLLHGCLTLGFNLPYFCWHPAMGSVGACRQCAVKQFKDEEDQRGRLVMACMTPAAEGTRISIHDPEAAAFRKGVIEGLMMNHPHDCPVCDEGGECHLQDMTVMTGHDYRRYAFEKRTFRNQYLGPFVNHEMNRCIQCYRCVRFYREYAGGRDFNVFSLRNIVYFGRAHDGVLENEFAGNLVEVCPTGVFTDATLGRHYTRKWDLQMAPSICVHCALGCNVSPGERYGMLRRIVNRYNGDVNGYFLCDRGRFGYEFVNSDRRIRSPRLRGESVSPEAARDYLREVAAGGRAVGIGSPRASLESNFALRALVGPERFFAGEPETRLTLLRRMIDILRAGPARTPSLREIELSDGVLLLGEDLSGVAPRMALSVRQSVRQQPLEQVQIAHWMDHAVREAVQDRKGPLFIATPAATRLDDVATRTFHGVPSAIARLGYDVARAIGEDASSSEGLAGEIAAALKRCKRPVVISGPSCGSAGVIDSAAAVARALGGAGLAYTAAECNSFGLAMMASRGLESIPGEGADTIIILENDLYRRAPAGIVNGLLSRFANVVALDSLENATTARAGLLLPAATFAEGDGTLVSSEGRAQRFFRVFAPSDAVQDSWRWLSEWKTLDEVIARMAAGLPQFAAAANAAPPAAFRMAGEKFPREPHRYSGRTAMFANITLHEPAPPPDPDAPLTFSMEGNPDQPPSPLIPFFWSPGWNSIQSVNKFQNEIAGELRSGNPGIRLIEPGQGEQPELQQAPPAFEQKRGDEWLVVPVWHPFGSDELSRHAPAVAQLAPEPYVALSPADASHFGEWVEVFGQRVIVRVASSVPSGVAVIPAGTPPFEGIVEPVWGNIRSGR